MSNITKNKIFMDLQTLPKCIRLYGGLKYFKDKIFAGNSQNCKISKKIFPLKYLGYTVI